MLISILQNYYAKVKWQIWSADISSDKVQKKGNLLFWNKARNMTQMVLEITRRWLAEPTP